MILVDTNVWVDHLAKGDRQLREILEAGLAITHPMVIGELACGSIRQRTKVLDLLKALPTSTIATHDEVLYFIEHNALAGKSIGYVDAQLLASVVLTHGATLLTRDKVLSNIASDMGLAWAGNIGPRLV